MALLHRVKVTWTGFPGAPGVSQFYSLTEPAPVLAHLRLAVARFADVVPGGITMTIENSGDVIDDATGGLVDAWATGAVAPVVGGAPGANTGASGAMITWLTKGIHRGRHLRGRTFVVPVSTSLYGADGHLSGEAVSALQAGADAFVAAHGGAYQVWGRPIDGSGGASSAITSAKVSNFAAVLRSRRG